MTSYQQGATMQHTKALCGLQTLQWHCQLESLLRLHTAANRAVVSALQVLQDAAVGETLAAWLDGGEQQCVFVSGSWLLQLPEAQQQEVIGTFSLLGYWQLAELDDGLLLASHQGLDAMQRKLQAKETQLFAGAGGDRGTSAAADADQQQGGEPGGADNAGQQPKQQQQQQMQGGQQQQQQAPGRRQQQQQQDPPDDQPSSGDPASPTSTASTSTAACDKCSYRKLRSNRWGSSHVLDGKLTPLPGPVVNSSKPELQLGSTVTTKGGELKVEMCLTACSRTEEVRQAHSFLCVDALCCNADALPWWAMPLRLRLTCLNVTYNPKNGVQGRRLRTGLVPGTSYTECVNISRCSRSEGQCIVHLQIRAQPCAGTICPLACCQLLATFRGCPVSTCALNGCKPQ